jgi:hypothetical protein
MCDAVETQIDHFFVEGGDGEVETVTLLEDVLGSKLRLLVLFMKNQDRNECTCLSSANSVDFAND